jgi:aminodeoxyfutalosine deaminase
MKKTYKTKWLLTGNSVVFEDAVLIVENEKITAIKTGKDFNADGGIDFLDFGNTVITPGFVNLHTHLQYTSLYKDFEQEIGNIDFADWIISLIKRYSQLSMEEKTASLKAGLDESLNSGVTCIAQLSKEPEFAEILSGHPTEISLFLEVFSNDKETSIQEFEKFKVNYASLKKNCPKNMHIGISPHSIYNVNEHLWKEIIDFALKENILVHTHLAESQAELDWISGKESDIQKLHEFLGWKRDSNLITKEKSIPDYIKRLGLTKLKSNLILAHLNFLSEKEISKLAEAGAGIAHCPRSNINLHSRTFDRTGFSKYVGIGTDSKASSLSLNILDEARFIKNNTNLDILEILDMLTINGARILRLENKKGSLEKGKDADFLVFKLKRDETYNDFLSQNQPDFVFVKGKLEVKNK